MKLSHDESVSRNILMKLEYRGTDFSGWQWQANHRTVQGVLQENLGKFLRDDVKLIGSGRTDAGVHALAQHANFMTRHLMRTSEIKYRLNRMLPRDVVILDCREVPLSFNARRDATFRTYRYLITERLSALSRDFSWVIARKLDLARLRSSAKMILRARDFANFCKVKSRKTNNICQIAEAAWSRRNGFLKFEITADRFLHNMVRLLVGSMVAVENGTLSEKTFFEMLENKKDQKTKYIAPACGLYLAEVGYERGPR